MKLKIYEGKISRQDREKLSDKFTDEYMSGSYDELLTNLVTKYFDNLFDNDIDYNYCSKLNASQIRDYVKNLRLDTMSKEEFDEYGYKSYYLEVEDQDSGMVLISPMRKY